MTKSMKRLILMVMLTMVLAIPALCTTGYFYITCNGVAYQIYLPCPGNQVPWAVCWCTTWSQTGGYSGCSISAGCGAE